MVNFVSNPRLQLLLLVLDRIIYLTKCLDIANKRQKNVYVNQKKMLSLNKFFNYSSEIMRFYEQNNLINKNIKHFLLEF
jgi:hypothetical protein